ncbi:hypothetical protein [Vibrio sp. WXL210]|uniref:hypothetical protein n=1 Tax=Vibrio sp. WXL210 TaxID=3450709 RepID=UPI003EC5ECD0
MNIAQYEDIFCSEASFSTLPNAVQHQFSLISEKLALTQDSPACLVILPAKAGVVGGRLRPYIIGVAVSKETRHERVCSMANELGVHVVFGDQRHSKARFAMENIGLIYDFRLRDHLVLQLAVVCGERILAKV